MKPRTLAILSALVAVLAVAALIDRSMARRRPRAAGTSDRLIPGLDPDAVTRVELRAAGRPEVLLVREGDQFVVHAAARAPGEPVPPAGARVEAPPATFPSDEAAVSDLLGDLEYLTVRRRVALPRQALTADLAARGLTPPRLVVVVHAGGMTWEIRVGNEEPALSRVWASLGESDTVVLIDLYAARALDRTADELRSRAPFVAATGGDVDLSITAGGDTARLRGKPPCVEIGSGCARADAERVDRLRTRLADLRLSRFTEPSPTPILSAVLDLRVGADVLRAGGPCADAPDELAVRSRAGSGCLPRALVEDLARGAQARDWVDRGLLAARPHTIRRISLPSGVLERQGGEWRFTEMNGDSSPAASSAVRDWLDELDATRATAVIDPPGGPPAARVTLTSDAGSETLLLHTAAGRAVVQRAGEPVALEAHPDVARLLAADRLQFRDRTLLAFEPFGLAAITFTGASPERAERADTANDWRLVAPFAAAADPDTVGALRDTTESLVALRVLAPRAAPEHGLPRRTLILDVDPPPTAPAGSPPTRLSLELGARFADRTCAVRRPGDETVFLLGAADCEALDAHLASRELFDEAVDDVTAVTLTGRRFERAGAGWSGPAGRLGDREAAELVALIAALRRGAEVVGYRPVTAGRKLELTVAGEGAPRTLTLLVDGEHYSLAGRAVRYRLSPEASELVGK